MIKTPTIETPSLKRNTPTKHTKQALYFEKPVEIQLCLVSNGPEAPRKIKSVTLTLSSLEEAWQIFEDLTHTAWEKIIQK